MTVEAYKAARDLLLANRTDYTAAYRDFRWPQIERFNWALDWFDAELVKRRVRPTALQPFWNVAGFALGAATALLGPRAAMACTVAVETEIDRHYQAQRDALAGSEPELEAAITEFQAEEVEHRDTALAHGAESTPGYPLLSAIIRAGCRTAIAAARRV